MLKSQLDEILGSVVDEHLSSFQSGKHGQKICFSCSLLLNLTFFFLSSLPSSPFPASIPSLPTFPSSSSSSVSSPFSKWRPSTSESYTEIHIGLGIPL